jgi:hypothetical protein
MMCDRVSPLTYTQQRFEKSLSYFPSAAGNRFLKTAEDSAELRSRAVAGARIKPNGGIFDGNLLQL